MRGLDAWIMGLNDPNAPFNQLDVVEAFEPIIDKCDWLSDEELDDNENLLFELCSNLMDELKGEKYYTSQETYKLMKDNAQQLADKLQTQFNNKKK